MCRAQRRINNSITRVEGELSNSLSRETRKGMRCESPLNCLR